VLFDSKPRTVGKAKFSYLGNLGNKNPISHHSRPTNGSETAEQRLYERLRDTPGAHRGVILGSHKMVSPPCVPDPKTYQTLYSNNDILKKITRKSVLFDSKPRTVVKAEFSSETCVTRVTRVTRDSDYG
jgi:hypothetical protein